MVAVPLSALLCVLHKKTPLAPHMHYKSVWANAGACCGRRLRAPRGGSADLDTSDPPRQQIRLSDAVL